MLELLSSLTVKISLNRAVEYMLQDCAVADTRVETQHGICSSEGELYTTNESLTAHKPVPYQLQLLMHIPTASEEMKSASRLSSVPSGCGSASGYSSSSEKSGYSSTDNEESSDIDCEV